MTRSLEPTSSREAGDGDWAGPVSLVGTCYCQRRLGPPAHGARPPPLPHHGTIHPIIRRGRAPDSAPKASRSGRRPPAQIFISSCGRCGAASPLTRHGRGQRERAVGRVVPVLASAAAMPCRDTVAGGFPTTLGIRNQRAQTSPTRRAYKEVPPLWLPLSHLSRLALTLASPELSRSEPNCPRASDPIPFAASSTTPRYSRVPPLLWHRFDPRKRSAVDSRFDRSPLELPVGVDFDFSCRFCCFCHVCFGSGIRIGGLVWFEVIQHITSKNYPHMCSPVLLLCVL